MITLTQETEKKLRAMVAGPEACGLPQIYEAAAELLAGLETDFSDLEFYKRSGSQLAAPEWAAPFVVETKVHGEYETPRDGTSYKSSVTIRGRWIVSVPGGSGDRAFQLPDGTLLWLNIKPGDAYSVSSGGFSNLRWGVGSPTVYTVEELGQEILRAAETVREWLESGLVIPPIKLPEDLTKGELFGVRFVQGPLGWVREGVLGGTDYRGGILRTPDGAWWSVDYQNDVSRVEPREKRRLRRQLRAGGTVRDYVERTRSYPTAALLAGFPDLFVEEERCDQPFRIITSYAGNGYGVIRRLMAGKLGFTRPPAVPPASRFREGSLSRFCAAHRLIPVVRTVTGISLDRSYLVILLREDGGAEVLRSFVTGPWAFLRKLQGEAKRVGRRLTEGELRELSTKPAAEVA